MNRIHSDLLEKAQILLAKATKIYEAEEQITEALDVETRLANDLAYKVFERLNRILKKRQQRLLKRFKFQDSFTGSQAADLETLGAHVLSSYGYLAGLEYDDGLKLQSYMYNENRLGSNEYERSFHYMNHGHHWFKTILTIEERTQVLKVLVCEGHGDDLIERTAFVVRGDTNGDCKLTEYPGCSLQWVHSDGDFRTRPDNFTYIEHGAFRYASQVFSLLSGQGAYGVGCQAWDEKEEEEEEPSGVQEEV